MCVSLRAVAKYPPPRCSVGSEMRSGKRSSRSQHALGRDTTFLKRASVTAAATPSSTASTTAAADPTRVTEPAVHAAADDRGSAAKPAVEARVCPPRAAPGASEQPIDPKLPAPRTPATKSKSGRPAKRSFDLMEQSQTEYVAIPTAQKMRTGAKFVDW